MKRRHLTNVRIERLALCASPAQDAATIVVAKRREPVSKIAPNPAEPETSFVARALSDDAMKSKYPDPAQRTAAAHEIYREQAHRVNPGDNFMTPEQEAALKAAETAAKNDAEAAKSRADRIAALSTDEFAIFKSLPVEKQDKFLALDAGARANEIAKSKDADPVIYTAKSGRAYRKSAGDALIELAKSNDEQAEELAKAREANAEQMLKSRAAEHFTKLPFSAGERVELTRMIEGGVCKDETIRKSIKSKLDNLDASLAKAFERAGVVGEAEAGTPSAEYDTLVKNRMRDFKEDEGTATIEVGKTSAGRAAYASIHENYRNGNGAR